MKPKLLDLFSGIGGFSLGLERAGFETVAFCEIAPSPRHLLATHWPNVPCFEDITTLTAEMVGPVDAICGGFPCQDISFAGKGAGLAGERSGLWREYARLVRELRPRYVIVENVAALLGRGLGDVLGDLASLGYDAWWDCIPASAVGAPHRRDRLWIVAYPGGEQHEGYGDALRREIAAGLSRAAALVAHTDGNGRPAREQAPETVGCGSLFAASGSDVAHAASDRRLKGRSKPERQQGRPCPAGGGASLAYSDVQHGEGVVSGVTDEEGRTGPFERSVGPRHAGPRGQWSAEPDVGRTLDGFSRWLDETYGDPEAHKVILAYANASEAGPRKALRDLRDRIRAEDDRRAAGGPVSVSPSEVLFAFVREHARRAEEGLTSLEGAAPPSDGVRSLRGTKGAARPPLRPGRDEQRAGEPSDPLQVVSQLLARHAEAAWIAYRWPDARASQPWVHGWEDGVGRVATAVPARVDKLHGLGNAVVPLIPEILGRAILAAQESITTPQSRAA